MPTSSQIHMKALSKPHHAVFSVSGDPHDSTSSSYPLSSASDDYESDESDDSEPLRTPTSTSPDHRYHSNIRSSLAALSNSRLREIVSRLTNSNPYFESLVAAELSVPPSPNTPRLLLSDHKRITLNSPPRPKPRIRTVSTGIPRECVACGQRSSLPPSSPFLGKSNCSRSEQCTFHNGHLCEELFEFLSRTPDGKTDTVLQKIPMWSCCAEEAKSPGCITAPEHLFTPLT